MNDHHTLRRILLVPALAALGLAGCNDDDDDPMAAASVAYLVTVTNLTYGQPLSPLMVALHGSGQRAWQAGQAASSGLEQLAEGGAPGPLAMALEAATGAVTGVGMAPIPPGSSGTVEIQLDQTLPALTVATMLVNTNDGFTGVTDWDISGLAPGESMSTLARVYDAGTEANSEAAGTLPGPADGGEGYNPLRDDSLDAVVGHGGVVSADDGLADSVLSEAHRFDNPGIRVTVTRL